MVAEKEFGEHGLTLCERVFWAWEIFQHTSDRGELKRAIRRCQREFKPIISSYASKRARNKYCRGMARNLIKAWPALWTFAAHPGVEPTNNHAELSLRSAVIYRKLSLGTQSQAANGGSSDSYLPTPPAAYRADRCSSTSPTRSPHTPAATTSHCSPEPPNPLNAYEKVPFCRQFA